MGNLLRLLSRDDCCSQHRYDVYLDFENARATEMEFPVWSDVQKVLRNSSQILCDLQMYKGASKEIKEAISNPTEENENKALEVVLPSIVPQLLAELCRDTMTPREHLEMQQALIKEFAEILEFMTIPSIQNDISFYRRILNRPSHLLKLQSTLNNELANQMSLFYANATPMLNVLSHTTSCFVKNYSNTPIEQLTELLRTMSKVCQQMVGNPQLLARFQREETQLFVLRVMVGLIILYDHVHPEGVFLKSSQMDVKGCIRVLKEQKRNDPESLLNALRYTTRHLNDETTPKTIRTLLAV